MLGTVGDLVDDVVVRLGGPINLASDTQATIRRRRGGSAANVAVSAVRAGYPARFIGQVGNDLSGLTLVAEMMAEGVDCQVRREGSTATIVVIVDQAGERSFLTDRGSADDLAEPEAAWLDGLTALHVPLYSLAGGRLAATARTLIGWARQLDLLVSIDASSSAVIEAWGPESVVAELRALAPDVLLCNELELDVLEALVPADELGAGLVAVKHGPRPTELVGATGRVEVAVPEVVEATDTTGAGDGFAAGFLGALVNGADPAVAALNGHAVALAAIRHSSS